MRARRVLPATLAVGAVSIALATSTIAQETKLRFPEVSTLACAPGAGVICGLRNPEDLDRILGGRWIIASGLAPGALYRIDARSRRTTDLLASMRTAWDRRLYPDCAAPLDRAGLLSHGIAVDRSGTRLLVVNHGTREAIEVFSLRARDAQPTWVGCVPLPDGLAANSVAALPADGFAVTNFAPPTPAGFAMVAEGRPSGDVRTWSPRGAWQTVPGSQGSGPNGILADADGRTLYVARSGSRDVVRIERQTGRVLATSVRLAIMPDNLRWRDAAASTLIVTGMKVDPAAALRCFAQTTCRPRVAILAFSRAKLSSTPVAELPEDVTGGPATTALAVDKTYWLGSFRSNRIDIVTPHP